MSAKQMLDQRRLNRRRLLRGMAAVAGSGVLLPVLAACSGSGSDQTGAAGLAGNQTVRYVDTEPPTMDPGRASTLGDLQIIDNVWEPLLGFDPQGNPVPLGATAWEVSPDGVTYTFHLRDGVHWSDGSTISAHDYEWAWKRNEDPKLASDYAQALYNVKGAEDYNQGKVADANSMSVRALDDQTLQVTLTGPAGYFLRIASTWTAMPLPKQAIDRWGDKWVEAGRAIGNGAFTIDQWKHDQTLVLRRNERYWGAKPTLSQINVKIVDDIAKTSLPAYENGELDYAIGPWPADMDRLQKDQRLSHELHIFPNSATIFVTCDTTKPGSPLQRADARRALYLAIDREQIAGNVFKQAYSPAYSILPDDIAGNNPNARIAGGIKEARQALAAAGYGGGQGLGPLTLTYSQSTDTDLIAQVLQQMWLANLGVKVNLNPLERKAYLQQLDSWRTGHFDLALSDWYSDYLDPFDWHNFLFKSDTDFFHAHWSNAQFDQLVNQAAIAEDQNRRRDLHQQAEALLVGQASQIPIVHPGTPYLIKPWVSGHVNDPTGVDHFAGVKLLKH